MWLNKFEEARTGAFRILSRLRDEGVIKGWGLGVNKTEPIELTLGLDRPQPDGFLLAGRYHRFGDLPVVLVAAWLGDVVIAAGLGFTAPNRVGALLSGTALLLALLAARLDRRTHAESRAVTGSATAEPTPATV